MKFTLFSICVLLIIITAVAIHSYKGYGKGVFRTFLTLAVNVCSIIFGILLSTIIFTTSPSIVEGFIDKFEPQINALVSSFGVKSIYLKVSDRYEPLLIMAGQFVLSTLFTIPCFFIAKIILVLVVDKVLDKRLVKITGVTYSSAKDGYLKRKSNIYGAIVGGFTGFMLAVFMLSPFIGGIQTAKRGLNIVQNTMVNKTAVVEVAEEGTEEKESASSTIQNALSKIEIPYANEFGLEFVYAVGGKMFFTSMANAKVLNKRTNVERELSTLEDFNLRELITLSEKFYSLSDENSVKTIMRYEKYMKKSLTFSVVSATFFSSTANVGMLSIKNSNRGIVELNNNAFSSISSRVLKIFSKTDGEMVYQNTKTLLNLALMLQDVDWKEVENDYTLLTKESGLMDKFSKELSKNPKTKHLVSEVEYIPATITTSAMSKKIKGKKYETFVLAIEDAIKQSSSLSDYKIHAELVMALEENLAKYDVEVSQVLLTITANLLIESLPKDLSKIETKNVAEFFENHGYVK